MHKGKISFYHDLPIYVSLKIDRRLLVYTFVLSISGRDSREVFATLCVFKTETTQGVSYYNACTKIRKYQEKKFK